MAKPKTSRKREDIKIKLASILRKDSADPRLEQVTIVEIKLSPDSSHATVFYTIFNADEGERARVDKALNEAAGFFQKRLGQSLTSRNTPRLHFVFDKGFDHASKIEKLLHQIKTESAAKDSSEE